MSDLRINYTPGIKPYNMPSGEKHHQLMARETQFLTPPEPAKKDGVVLKKDK